MTMKGRWADRFRRAQVCRGRVKKKLARPLDHGLRDVHVARPDLRSSWVFAGDSRLDFALKPVEKYSLKVVTPMKCLRMSPIRSYWCFLSLKPKENRGKYLLVTVQWL